MATESVKKSSSSSNIPPEIIEIILSKLPSVKSLVRFKAVSKSWNTIISDPLFIQNHLQSSNNSPNNNLFISSYTDGSGRGFPLDDFEVRKANAGKISGENIPNGYNSILCECNGVLLLSNLIDVKFALWNPSIRCEMFLIYKHEFREDYIVDYGICYDQITGDFKVVFIFPTKYAIYSCDNNSLTKKNLVTSYHTIGGTGSGLGIFVDGATYWILRDNMNSIHLVYFDPRTDEIKRLQKPEQRLSDDDKFILMNIASLRGRLCLYFYNKEERIVQIWMKEKGIDKWKEFITFHNFEAPYELSRPICLVENKVVIQVEENIFVYYSTSTDKSVNNKEFVHIYGDRRKLIPYRNSLYFPTGVGTKKIKAQQSRLIFT